MKSTKKVLKANLQNIALEIQDELAVVRFDRPDSKNTLSIRTLDELEAAFELLSGLPEIKGIVFTGSGDTFASGANLREIQSLNGESARDFALRGQSVLQKIYRSRKSTVAAINGFCMGGGLDLALSCKSRIAVPEAVFAHPGANLGIITGWGGTQLLPRLIGQGNALEIFMTAQKIDAEQALKIGLIDKVSEDLLNDARELLAK